MGYDWTRGKSVRAVIAERNGLRTATALAKELRHEGLAGCTARDVADVLTPTEWHHTSKFFRKTNYYDWPEDAELDRLREHIAKRRESEWIAKVADLGTLRQLGVWVREPHGLASYYMLDASLPTCTARPADVLQAARRLRQLGFDVVVALRMLRRCYRLTPHGWVRA